MVLDDEWLTENDLIPFRNQVNAVVLGAEFFIQAGGCAIDDSNQRREAADIQFERQDLRADAFQEGSCDGAVDEFDLVIVIDLNAAADEEASEWFIASHLGDRPNATASFGDDRCRVSIGICLDVKLCSPVDNFQHFGLDGELVDFSFHRCANRTCS